jgi:hypothetical protein
MCAPTAPSKLAATTGASPIAHKRQACVMLDVALWRSPTEVGNAGRGAYSRRDQQSTELCALTHWTWTRVTRSRNLRQTAAGFRLWTAQAMVAVPPDALRSRAESAARMRKTCCWAHRGHSLQAACRSSVFLYAASKLRAEGPCESMLAYLGAATNTTRASKGKFCLKSAATRALTLRMRMR